MANLGSIHTYRSEVDRIIRFGGSTKETSIRRAVFNLINAYARPRDLLLVEELDYFNPRRDKTVRPDGTLKNILRIDQGFWESKDTDDDLTEEIKKKFDRGYPDSNILFEDSQTAILYQDGARLLTAPFAQAESLDELLTAYVSFENQDVLEFRKAVERFKDDIPNIVTALRGMIQKQGKANATFRQRRGTFLELCRSAINPAVTPDDVDEMLIQHILTEEIFLSIFSDTQLLDENNIARELKQVENTFFTGATKRDTLGQIKHYYECIKAHATSIVSPREKQTFLKVIYENFYKAYNPKGADRLGIVYTPGEVIDFMIRSTDTLLHRHFGRGLADQAVEILDPATGTGSYVCDLIEYLPREVLARKYKHELHANEVAILPYYIANLNIETAYAAKMGSYAPFENICFVDTLDNTEGLRVENQWELGAMSVENTRRIKAQNKRKISVIIGNPPYNANQQNENDNNKNRTYEHIDKRIKATYIAASTAQKTKVYDMYARFIRWASDRLADQGIVAYICNRSFIDSRTFDGFRKVAAQEFNHIYILDTKSDVRANPKLSGTKHNVFGIQTGVAIVFFVKDQSHLRSFDEAEITNGLNRRTALPHPGPLPLGEGEPCAASGTGAAAGVSDGGLTGSLSQRERVGVRENGPERAAAAPTLGTRPPHPCRIYYTSMADEVPREEKLEILSAAKIETLDLERIEPDADGNWLDMNVSDFKSLIPLVGEPKKAVFGFSSNGIKGNRDEWVYDVDEKLLAKKTKFLCEEYNRLLKERDLSFPGTIKWSEHLKSCFTAGQEAKFLRKHIVKSLFRPFTELHFFSDKVFNDRLTEKHYQMYGPGLDKENVVIAVHSITASFRLSALAAAKPFDYGFIKQGNGGTFGFPLYRYDSDGHRQDNLTDWGLRQFQQHYGDAAITKRDLFHYTYAVLHHPAYRTKYEINLKREFPRLPFYADFRQWAAWGEQLMALHLNYEQAAPFPLERRDAPAAVLECADMSALSNGATCRAVGKRRQAAALQKEAGADKPQLKPKLKAIKETGSIEIDATTTLAGIPAAAWDYKLGNRSGLEWVLDQWKEHKISDPTVAAKFNTYHFADHKEEVIKLLLRVCTVSMETMKIVKAMMAVKEE